MNHLLILAIWLLCGIISFGYCSMKPKFDWKIIFPCLLLGPIGLIELTCRDKKSK